MQMPLYVANTYVHVYGLDKRCLKEPCTLESISRGGRYYEYFVLQPASGLIQTNSILVSTSREHDSLLSKLNKYIHFAVLCTQIYKFRAKASPFTRHSLFMGAHACPTLYEWTSK